MPCSESNEGSIPSGIVGIVPWTAGGADWLFVSGILQWIESELMVVSERCLFPCAQWLFSNVPPHPLQEREVRSS